MSEYVMMPGARLMVGPHGKLEESLGASCYFCQDYPGQGLGDDLPVATKSHGTKEDTAMLRAGGSAAKKQFSSASSKSSGGLLATISAHPLYVAAGVAAVGAAAYLVLRKRK